MIRAALRAVLAFVFLVVSLYGAGVIGCTSSQLAAAKTAANGAHETGNAAATVVNDLCTQPYNQAALIADAATRKARIAKLDSYCDRLIRAHDAHRAIHAAFVAFVSAAETSGDLDEAGLFTLTRDLAIAAKELSEALAAASGAQR